MQWATVLGALLWLLVGCSGVDPKGLVLGPLIHTQQELLPYFGHRGRYKDGHEEWVSLGPRGWESARRWLGGFDQTSPGQAHGFRWVPVHTPQLGRPGLWQLHWEGVPVEGAWARVQEGSWVSATKPPLDLLDLPQERHPFTSTPTAACSASAAALGAHRDRCRFLGQIYVWSSGEGLRPAYKTTISAHPQDPGPGPRVPQEVLVDGQTDQVLGVRPLALHMEGLARVWSRNLVASPEGETLQTLPGLRPPGHVLSNDLFDVKSCSDQPLGPWCDGAILSCALNPTCGRQAISGAPPDFTAFTFETNAYDEVLAYHSISRALKWHMGLATNSPSVGPWGPNRSTLGLHSANRLEVYTRTPLCTQTAGCLYENAGFFIGGLTGYGPPQIVIGPGYVGPWPPPPGTRRLRHLGKDADVVTHELAHLVLYRSLMRIAGQTGVLHEGTADYFTYALMGSNKLAQGTTPDGQPLRVANLTGSAQDYVPPENSNSAAHRFGVFWSSALLDLREALGPWQGPYALADKVVWDSIDYMKPDAGYYDAIGALAQAATDLAEREGRSGLLDRQKIFSTFHRFGFLTHGGLDGRLPPNALQTVSGQAAPPPPTSAPVPVGKGGSRRSGGCGVVALGSGAVPGPGYLFVFLGPVFMALVKGCASLLGRVRGKKRG